MSKFKKGDLVLVKVYKKRPPRWNRKGEMDKWMGKLVKVGYIGNTGAVKIEEDLRWVFREEDFEIPQLLEDSLFEI